jgi:stearoyl-CoA desaturase (delta-9 desaturase)
MKELSFHTKLIGMLSIHFVLFLYAITTSWNAWYLLAAWILAKAIGYIGNEIGMHRFWSHKSFKTEKWKEILMHICSVPLLCGSSIAYVGTHRQHHAHSDTEKDPHQTGSVLKTLFYIRDSKFKISPKIVADLIKCPLHRFLHEYYFHINLVVLIVSLLSVGPVYTGWFLSGIIFYNFLIIGLVNIYGHNPQYGKRNFETNDYSTNNFWLQALTWNHGLHNNHHKYPSNYRMNIKPNEFDFPGWLIEKFFIKERSK